MLMRCGTTLCQMYYKGEGVEQSYERAFEILQQAAQLGLAAAQFGLGEMYKDGHGVAQDFVPQSSLQKQQHWEMLFKHNME